jgi:hypothetical protein
MKSILTGLLFVVILITSCSKSSNDDTNIPLGTFEADINGVHENFDSLLISNK